MAFSSRGPASSTPISCETEKYNLEAEVQEEPQGEIKSILWSRMAWTPLSKHRERLLSCKGPRQNVSFDLEPGQGEPAPILCSPLLS